ncbi:MAG: hypothetical protein RIS43_804 [Actinomycetota bacterium]
MSQVRSWVATGNLGFRLLRGMGTVRSLMVVVSSAIAGFVLLSAITLPLYFERHDQAQSNREPLGASGFAGWHQDQDGLWTPTPSASAGSEWVWYPRTQHKPDLNSTERIAIVGEPVGTSYLTITMIAGEGPVPPGIPALPTKDISYASPDFIERLKTDSTYQKYFGNSVVKEITSEGLASPRDLLAYVAFDEKVAGASAAEYLGDASSVIIAWGRQNDSPLNLSTMLIPLGALGIPILAFMLAASRMSASVRERRLASLRLIGLSKARTQFLASIETVVTSAVGALLGVVAYFAAIRIFAGAVIFDHSWFVETVSPTFSGVAFVLVFIPLLSLMSSALPLHKISRKPLAVVKRAKASHPSWWRLLPLIGGGAAMLHVIATPVWDSEGHYILSGTPEKIMLGIFVLGAIALAVGVPLGVPIIARMIGKGWAAIAKRPAFILASRGIQHDPTSTTRLISTFLTVLLVGTVGAAMLSTQASNSYYQYVHLARTTGPNVVSVSYGYDRITGKQLPTPNFAEARKMLTSIPGVQDLVQTRYWDSPCNETNFNCYQIVEISCDVLQRLDFYSGECKPGEVLLPSRMSDQLGTQGLLSGHVQINGWRSIEDVGLKEPEAFDITLPKARIAEFSNKFYGSSFFSMVVSTGFNNLPAGIYGQDSNWYLLLDAGDNVDTIEKNVTRDVQLMSSSMNVYPAADPRVLTEYDRTMSIARLVTVTAGLIALLALLVTSLDRARERRRLFAMQRVAGVSSRTLLVSQILQGAIPLLIGAIAAGGVAMLVAKAILHTSSRNEPVMQWGALWTTAGLGLVAVIAMGLSAIPSVKLRLRAQDLRRE